MDRAYRLHFDRRLLFQAVVVLAVVGGILAWRRRRHGVLAAALTGFLCLGAAYTFSYVHVLQQTEPYRYVATATLLFAIPAISGLAWILGRLASLGREQRLAVACIALLAVPAATGYLVDLASARNTFRADTLRVTGEVALLREFQPAQARILCESEPLGSVVPWYLGAEVIGGYHSGWFPMTYGLYAHCSDRRVFGLPPDAPDAYNPARLNAYLDLYNVGLVAAHTPALTGAMAADPRWRQVASRSSLALFERASGAPAGYLEGVPAATVERQDGTLVIDGAPPGESLLRYHYLPGMHADGGVALHPIKRLDDPAPFVGIDNPAGLDRITIHLR